MQNCRAVSKALTGYTVPHKPYVGSTKFNKHYTKLIGDMKADGEEFDCAVHLDRHEKVRYWIRNVDRQKTSFWLQLPDTKFYPDFVVMLKDGRILIVEYKGEVYRTNDDSKIKMQIGDLWAEASNGRCLFCMPTARDFSTIDRLIE